MNTGTSTAPASQTPTFSIGDSLREELWFGDADPFRSEEEAARSTAAAVAQASGLKPFPATAGRALEILSDPDFSMKELEATFERDAALAARLLRVANSPLYRGRTACSSIDQAVTRLGTRSVGELVAAAATLGMFEDASGVGLRFRDHGVGVAAMARVLADSWETARVEDVFLCGLLHDVGKLLSLQVGEVDYPAMGTVALSAPDEVHLLERELLGYDHAVLGAHVIADWGLPDFTARAVALHHQPSRAADEGQELGLVVSLVRVADQLEYAFENKHGVAEAVAAAVKQGDAQFAGFSAERLEALWPTLAQARADLLAALA